MKGLVFAIEEMAVHDGPGLRTCVFLKGCPLRCQWCHNPEGLEMKPQRMRSPNGCLHCGACETPCKDHCVACGKCLPNCPRGLLRISGKWWESDALAQRILMNAPMLRHGGVTLSGGEVMLQAPFAIELLDKLSSLHRAIETSGYGDETLFRELIKRLELVYFDVKLADPERHRQYTGVSNEKILRNLSILRESGVPFIARIPTIAGVNDSVENMTATRDLLLGSPALQQVEILPYNLAAGSKYAMVGRVYEHDSFTRPSDEVLERDRLIFEDAGIRAIVRRSTN